MPLPTMVIAGAQKCGTSSLSSALLRHPQTYMSGRKELHFFDRKFKRGLDWYASQFTPDPRQTQFGEATPSYMFQPEARDRMLATLPEARLIVILRDPAERAYSHYWHNRRRGEEDKPFEEALDLEQQRITSPVLEGRALYSYVDRGHYIDQILSLEAGHDRSLLHVLLLDDLKADHVATLETVFRFLGVDPEPARAIPEQRRNRYRVHDPEGGGSGPVEYPPMSIETRARLVDVFHDSNRRLAEWLGRDLAAWSKV